MSIKDKIDDENEDMSENARRVFSETYQFMALNQGLMKHPLSALIPDNEWATICWNASMLAACNVDGTILRIVGQDGDGLLNSVRPTALN